MCCLFSIAAPTQGVNVKHDEMDALGDVLSSAQWNFPAAQEYKNELVQPAFLGLAEVPKSKSQAMVPATPRMDPEAPAADEQWKKLNKMVALSLKPVFVFSLVFRINLFRERGLVFRINLLRKCALIFGVSRFRKCASPTCVLCCVLVQVDITQSMEKESMKLYDSLVASRAGNSGERDRLEKLLEDFGNMGD